MGWWFLPILVITVWPGSWEGAREAKIKEEEKRKSNREVLGDGMSQCPLVPIASTLPPSQSLLSTSSWVLFLKWLFRKLLASSLTDPPLRISLLL